MRLNRRAAPFMVMLACMIVLLLAMGGCAGSDHTLPHAYDDEIKGEIERQTKMHDEEIRRMQVRADLISIRLKGMNTEICGEPCRWEVEIVEDNAIMARALESRVINISTGLMRNLNDNRLALVIAHEAAHLVMSHHEKSRWNEKGNMALRILSPLTWLVGNKAYQEAERAQESEADMLGLYMAARAGYDEKDAAGFWRQLSALYPEALHEGEKHPSTAARAVRAAKTVEEIRQKRKQGWSLLP